MAENNMLAAFSRSIFIHFCTSAFKSKDCAWLVSLFTLALLSLKFSHAETFPLQCKLCIIQIRRSRCVQEQGNEYGSHYCSKYQRTFKNKTLIGTKACISDEAVG